MLFLKFYLDIIYLDIIFVNCNLFQNSASHML